MVWLYRSPIPAGRRVVISSFKWLLPTYAPLRGGWGLKLFLQKRKTSWIYNCTIDLRNGEIDHPYEILQSLEWEIVSIPVWYGKKPLPAQHEFFRYRIQQDWVALRISPSVLEFLLSHVHYCISRDDKSRALEIRKKERGVWRLGASAWLYSRNGRFWVP